METGNPSVIRKINREAVLSFVRENHSCSRAKLAKQLKLAPATVSSVVKQLIDDGLIIETGMLNHEQRSPGRPSKHITLNAKAGYIFGLVIDTVDNQLSITAMISDYSGTMTEDQRFVVESDFGESHVVQAVYDVCQALRTQLPKKSNIIAVAIGIPGVVVDRSILHAPRLTALIGHNFHTLVSKKLKTRVFLENDVNLALYSEANARPELRKVNYGYLFISLGVGSGIALAGDIWTSTSWSGEVGHIAVPFGEQGLEKLENIIGLDGLIITRLKAFGVNLNMAEFDPFCDVNDDQTRETIKRLIEQYVQYLLVAVQGLNAAVGLDEIILNSRETGFLNYIHPMMLEHIAHSPLQLSVSISQKSETSLAQGATLFGLKSALQEFEQRS